MADIQAVLAQKQGSLRRVVPARLRTALLVAVGLAVFGQLSGVNIVVYYGPEILKSAHMPLQDAFQWQVVLGIINFIFTVVAILTVDRWGRRPLLIGGMAAVTLYAGGDRPCCSNPMPIRGGSCCCLCLYMACEAMSISRRSG